jgi:ribosomal-protein-alanine N-acetyltransferase
MIAIRQVGPEAAELLAAIHETASADVWSGLDMAQLLSSPGSAAFLAEAHGEPLAFVMIRLAAEEGEILTLATRPTHRRQGLARQLMGAAAVFGRSRGASRLLLEVADDNAAALALYGGLGYLKVGARRGYYRREGGPVDAQVLRFDL